MYTSGFQPEDRDLQRGRETFLEESRVDILFMQMALHLLYSSFRWGSLGYGASLY